MIIANECNDVENFCMQFCMQYLITLDISCRINCIYLLQFCKEGDNVEFIDKRGFSSYQRGPVYLNT